MCESANIDKTQVDRRDHCAQNQPYHDERYAHAKGWRLVEDGRRQRIGHRFDQRLYRFVKSAQMYLFRRHLPRAHMRFPLAPDERV